MLDVQHAGRSQEPHEARRQREPSRPAPKALENLNSEQRMAVTHPPGRVLVIAGAGSGKTRVLTRRAAFLIQERGIQPDSILAITLTNKAAREMIGRLRKLCGAGAAERIAAGTFHATCARILRSHPNLIERTAHFQIYDETETERLLARILTREEKALVKTARTVRREISVNKNHAVPLQQYGAVATDKVSRTIARAWAEYEAELKRANALDFDDLLLRTVELLRQYPDIREGYQEKWQHVLVDEYQDTNPIQARLLRLLAGHDFMVVGDDKQVIYGFRLADVRLILEFDEEYPDARVLTLEENYRNSPQILKVANRLISHNTLQRPMALRAHKRTPDGPEPQVHFSSNDVEEAQWIAARIQRFVTAGVNEREIAIFARHRKVVDRFEHALAAAGISFRRIDGAAYFQHKEIRAVLAHLRLIVNPRNEEAFALALSLRPRVAEKTIAKIISYAQRNNLTMLEAATAVDLISGIKDRQAKENTRRFAYDMLAFTRAVQEKPVSQITHEVIRMPLGVADALASRDDTDEEFTRLRALTEAAATYEQQSEEPTLAAWLQDVTLAGRDDLETQEGRGKVTLGTIHSIKGLEWPIVIAGAFEGRVIPSSWARTPEAIEEERRMAYVLFTRATRILIISYSLVRDGRRSGPSLFINEGLHDRVDGHPPAGNGHTPQPNTA